MDNKLTNTSCIFTAHIRRLLDAVAYLRTPTKGLSVSLFYILSMGKCDRTSSLVI